MEAVLLGLVLMLSIFLGFEVISKVPSTLHTPLMSGANAISGIAIVGAIVVAARADGTTQTVLGVAAIAMARLSSVSSSTKDQMVARARKSMMPRVLAAAGSAASRLRSNAPIKERL